MSPNTTPSAPSSAAAFTGFDVVWRLPVADTQGRAYVVSTIRNLASPAIIFS
jgi:hypothetical protein